MIQFCNNHGTRTRPETRIPAKSGFLSVFLARVIRKPAATSNIPAEDDLIVTIQTGKSRNKIQLDDSSRLFSSSSSQSTKINQVAMMAGISVDGELKRLRKRKNGKKAATQKESLNLLACFSKTSSRLPANRPKMAASSPFKGMSVLKPGRKSRLVRAESKCQTEFSP